MDALKKTKKHDNSRSVQVCFYLPFALVACAVNHSTWWEQSLYLFIVHETKSTYSHLDVSIYCCEGWSLLKQMTKKTNIFAPIKSWILNMEKCMFTFDLVAMYNLG